ncbi:hypothetical protein ACWCPT_28210 [Streptomyces sp. NPDC002308]
MASLAHTHVRAAGNRRSAPGRFSAASTGRPPGTADSEGPGRPITDTQVRNWAESAVLMGYGPTVSHFL